MTALIVLKARQAIADRKGVTALEYALVASAIAVVVVAAFSNFGSAISTLLQETLTQRPSA
jgi:Flp pilus assembly pilin Flp